MKEDISVQLLAQTSDNIQKLFDLSTRIDERVKSLQKDQSEIKEELGEVVDTSHIVIQRIAVAESKLETPLHEEVVLLQKTIIEIDKRLRSLEKTSEGNESRWNAIFQFITQLVWITLAAYVLYKLNLSPPPVP